MKTQQIVDIARERVGTPYGLYGCAGLPIFVWVRLGLPEVDWQKYGREPNPVLMRTILDTHLEHASGLQLGDVVWLNFKAAPQHLGIIANYKYGGFSLIHAYNGEGLSKVIEHRLDKAWLSRITGAWRYPGVEI